jgi:filamentous hemagglutinin family protein
MPKDTEMMPSQMTTVSAFLRRSVSELALRRGAALLLMGLPALAQAQSLPVGETVVHGDVAVSRPGTNAMVIQQGSGAAAVNWDSFSIGQGARVDIQQPNANAAILNRVTGDTTSAIHGQLNANGQVYVVNPNGVFIGPTGTINAGGFVASTLDIDPDDFVLGQRVFNGNGSSASVHNEGTIDIVQGGYAALLGGRVKNAGMIRVPLGQVALGAGERITLDFGGDGFLQVAVPSAADGEMGALIENSGSIIANGGQVAMSAATARDAALSAINLDGVVEARGFSGTNGNVTLGGGMGGRVTVSGRVSTRATQTAVITTPEVSLRPKTPQRGGDITITGSQIVLDGAQIDASGINGGGTIRIGGNQAGAAGLQTAATLSGDADTTILADAGQSGDGGRVILWSDDHTIFAGDISARGGDLSGDGGFAEVSGKINLSFSGHADLRAPNGAFGELLLDPTNMTIVSGPTINPNEISAQEVVAQLAFGDYTVRTAAAGSDLGDLTVNAAVSWTNPTTLNLVADHDIAINAPITASAGTLYLFAGNAVSTSTAGTIDVARFDLAQGNWSQIGTLASFSAGDFRLGSLASFLRAAGGAGSTASPYQISDVYGLQGIGSGLLGSAHYELVNDIDASGTSGWNAGIPLATGFVPISSFTGSLNGNQYSVSGLTMDRAALDAGMFATIGLGGSVTNMSLTGANVTVTSGGILAGRNNGTLTGVSTSGTLRVSDGSSGGLVGTNAGTISDSFSSAAISDTLGGPVPFTMSFGGLVGQNQSIITRSHSNGSVTATNQLPSEINAGGLAGVNIGSVSDSYAQTSVQAAASSTARLGGLIGDNAGTVDRTFASGAVTASGSGFANVGGLIGANNSGSVSSSFYDTTRTTQTISAGGTALSTAELQDTIGFIARAQPLGWNFATVWAPGETGFDPALYSTSPVIFATPDNATFVYNGSDTGFAVTGTFTGGTDLFRFGVMGDTLDAAQLNNNVLAVSNQVGQHSFSYQDPRLSSTRGITFRVVDRPALVDITPAPLTVTANDQTKTAGEEFVFNGTEFTTTALVAGDSVTSAELSSEGSPAAAPEGTFDILVGAVNGVGLGNYTITQQSGTFTVNAQPVVVPDPPVVEPVPPAPEVEPGTPQINPVQPGVETLPNPSDSAIVLPGDDVQTQQANASALRNARETLGIVDGLSTTTEIAIASCAGTDQDIDSYLTCLSAALDTYANALDEIALDLPEEMQNVSAIIQTARRTIDASAAKARSRLATATTDAERRAIRTDAVNEARAAISTAETEIRKAISLIRVEEPELVQVHQQTITRVADVFVKIDSELVRAADL